MLRTLQPRFAQLVWTPGNHDLWTPQTLRGGEARRRRTTSGWSRLCSRYGVLTPEDPYARWPGDGPTRAIVPTFLLFDYSFRPDRRDARATRWRGPRSPACDRPTKICSRPIRIATRDDWCAARVAATEARLAALPADVKLIVANHFPLRRDLAVAAAHPALLDLVRHDADRTTGIAASTSKRWSTATCTCDRARAIDGVRFEEVSLGYPKQWNQSKRLAALPAPDSLSRRWYTELVRL